ncbi:hypothetical protein QQ020_03760 [Fulvivirgaceae bacterium BMA12]|uniref:Group-specific protein n=2 Tax=Agaribacillus aureus TaxID=3051825 RepID=A0ABT8L2V0_9BACT|nr:hypothetical protein [Fulvivirgaceae bacterium BMA12]
MNKPLFFTFQIIPWTNVIKKRLLTLLILAPVFFGDCSSGCSDTTCPVKCANISFKLLRNGVDIFIQDPDRYNINSVRVEAATATDAPPLLKVNTNNVISFVVCHEIDYKLYLNDSEVIDIRADLSVVTSDECCDFFGAHSVWFNGMKVCSDHDECQLGLEFELL